MSAAAPPDTARPSDPYPDTPPDDRAAWLEHLVWSHLPAEAVWLPILFAAGWLLVQTFVFFGIGFVFWMAALWVAVGVNGLGTAAALAALFVRRCAGRWVLARLAAGLLVNGVLLVAALWGLGGLGWWVG